MIGNLVSRLMAPATPLAITSGEEGLANPLVEEPVSRSSLPIQGGGAPTPSTLMVRSANGGHEIRSVNPGIAQAEFFKRAILNKELSFAAFFYKSSDMRQTQELEHSSITQLKNRESVSMSKTYAGIMFKKFLENLRPRLMQMLSDNSAYDTTAGAMGDFIRPHGVPSLGIATDFTKIEMIFPGKGDDDVAFTMRSSNQQAEYIQEILDTYKPGDRGTAIVKRLISALELAGVLHLSSNVDRKLISDSLKLTNPVLRSLSVCVKNLPLAEQTSVMTLLNKIVDSNEGFRETYDEMKEEVFLSSFIVMCLFLINPTCLGSHSMDLFAMLRDEFGPIAAHFIICAEAREEFRKVFGVELLPAETIFNTTNKEKTVKARLFYVLACLTIHCNESINENIMLSPEQLSQLLFSLAATMVTHVPEKSIQVHQKEANRLAAKVAGMLASSGGAGGSHVFSICAAEDRITAQIQVVMDESAAKGKRGKNNNDMVFDYGPVASFIDNFVRLFPKNIGCRGHVPGAGAILSHKWLELNPNRSSDEGPDVFSRDANSFNDTGLNAEFRDADNNFPMVIVHHFIEKLNSGDYPVNTVACLITSAMKETNKKVDVNEGTKMHSVGLALVAGLQNTPRVPLLGYSPDTPGGGGASSSSQRGQSAGGDDRIELIPIDEASSADTPLLPDEEAGAPVSDQPLSANGMGKRKMAKTPPVKGTGDGRRKSARNA